MSLPKPMLLAFAVATPLAAVAIHITMSLVAPGDGGTALALASVIIFVLILMSVGFVGMLLFPLAAALSWPIRDFAFDHPILGFILASGLGLLAGFGVQFLGVSAGPGDNFSAPLAGGIYAIVWFVLMRRFVGAARAGLKSTIRHES